MRWIFEQMGKLDQTEIRSSEGYHVDVKLDGRAPESLIPRPPGRQKLVIPRCKPMAKAAKNEIGVRLSGTEASDNG
jgi:hypothetical protein